MKRITWIFWMIVLFQSCKMEQHVNATANVSEDKVLEEVVLYLVFELFKTENEQMGIELLQVHRSEKSEKVSFYKEAIEEHQLSFHFLDQNKSLLQEVKVDNPLFKSYGLFAESGQNGKVKGALDRSKLVLRVDVRSDVAFVKVANTEGLEKVFEL